MENFMGQNNHEKTAYVLRMKHLPRVTGLSLSTINRLRAQNNFVPVIRLTQNSVGFLRSDVEQWVLERREN